MVATEAQRAERWLLHELPRRPGASLRALIRAYDAWLVEIDRRVSKERTAAAVRRGLRRLRDHGWAERVGPDRTWELTSAGEAERQRRLKTDPGPYPGSKFTEPREARLGRDTDD